MYAEMKGLTLCEGDIKPDSCSYVFKKDVIALLTDLNILFEILEWWVKKDVSHEYTHNIDEQGHHVGLTMSDSIDSKREWRIVEVLNTSLPTAIISALTQTKEG
jgi:hypothetical protein